MIGSPDPAVRVFDAQSATAWRAFRLGGGLNVIVSDPSLPSEFAWRFPTHGISSSPTVMGATMFVSANDHHVYALDVATGHLRWRYHAENEVMSQPAYANGLVYVGTGNSDAIAYYPPTFVVTGSGVNRLEALDARTGVERWWSGLAGAGMPSAAILGSAVVAVDGAGSVLAVDARSGAYRWSRRLYENFAMSAVLDGHDGRLYLAGGFPNAVFAIRASDGAPIWKHAFDPLDGGISDGPLALAGTMLVGTYLEPRSIGPYGREVTYQSRAREHVYALAAQSGRLVWDMLLPNTSGNVPKFNEAAIPLVYGKRIFVGSAMAPTMSALAFDGRLLWRLHVGGAVKGGIAAYDETLYFGDESGKLWAVDATNGHPVGDVATDMHFNVGSPIIVNGTLIIGSRSDTVALPLADIRDSHELPGITQLTLWERVGRLFHVL
jgi:outer membrane protein assembly factor BamB